MTRLVCSEVNTAVENPDITTAQASAGHHVFNQLTLGSLGPVEEHYSSL
jgi:hypothetical protein